MNDERVHGNADPADRVHVRRLGAVDTLRWSWEVLTDRLELVALSFAASLLSVVASLGVTQPTPESVPTAADWVWPLYLLYFVAITVVWGVVFLTAEDAVADRTTPLGDRVTTAAFRLPALVGAALVLWPIVAVGFVLLVIPGVYLFHRLVLAFPACVIDRKGPFAGLSAGWNAARGDVFKIFLVSVAYFVLSFAIGLVSTALGGLGIVGTLVSTAVGAVVGPLYGLALGHLYLENSRNT